MSLSHKLDQEYETTRKKIVKLKPNIHRRRQVRVKNWLKKLDEPTTVLTWQRLRNKYAKSTRLNATRVAKQFSPTKSSIINAAFQRCMKNYKLNKTTF